MTNIELYIDQQLCDINNDLGVRLNRQLLEPGQLNTKDAQYSYSISLPPTGDNQRIFKYSNVEENRNKFNRLFDAELVINSVRIFRGKFKLSEISEKAYKGNLYIPAVKTVKDIFADTSLNNSPEWTLPFCDPTTMIADHSLAASIDYYNTNAAQKLQPCIFPYVLYGLLPKYPTGDANYSDSGTWDDLVQLGIEDLPPSVNVLQMLTHIFESHTPRLSLAGSAFEDARLTSLYMSYKNPSDYPQPWNWGDLGLVKLSGTWQTATPVYDANNVLTGYSNFERHVENIDKLDKRAYVDLLSTNNATISLVGSGVNTLYTETPDVYKDDNAPKTKKEGSIKILASGWYKIALKADIQLDERLTNKYFYPDKWTKMDDTTGFNYFINAYMDSDPRGSVPINSFANGGIHEILVLRDFDGGGDFNVGEFGKPFGGNETPVPMDGGSYVVDVKDNPNLLAGLHFEGFGDSKNGLVNAYMFIQNGGSIKDTTLDTEIYSVYDSSNGRTDGNYWDATGNPTKYAYGQLKNFPPNSNYALRNGNAYAEGAVSCAVWLTKGEYITLALCSEQGGTEDQALNAGWGISMIEALNFDLQITPFQTDKNWGNFDPQGNSIATLLDWEANSNFRQGSIDLCKFLPTEVKVNEFVDNLCQTFNLQLTQYDATHFALDAKQRGLQTATQCVDIDGIASIRDRTNQPLNLPSEYDLSFAIDKDEQGLVESFSINQIKQVSGEKGKGVLTTDSVDGVPLAQQSNFSYNWFKQITKDGINLLLPIVSKQDIYNTVKIELSKYGEGMNTRYTDLSLRFWYYKGLLNDAGTNFNLGESPVQLAQVSNTFSMLPYIDAPDLMSLDLTYNEGVKNSILHNYFALLTDASSHYTLIDCYLSPQQYARLNGDTLVRFNGDIYYLGEIINYDPSGRNKTQLKLIRKVM